MITDESFPFDPAMSGPPTVMLFFFGLVATLVVAGFAFVIVKGLSQWRANEAAPLRSVEALVVSRRSDVHRRAATVGVTGTDPGSALGSGTPAHTSTTYFVTFEEPSGERRELMVSGRDFGQLAEGDRGHLMHQGTRYKGFTRQTAVDGPH